MGDFTVITQKSWFSRLGDALKGILLGLALILAAIILLWWNEGRAVLTAKGLREGAALVVAAPSDRVDPTNEGKLTHVSGRAIAGQPLADPDFPSMTVKGLILRRQVEVFQWKEEKKTKEDKKAGGSVEKVTTYSYKKAWSSSLHDSSRFHEPAGHGNPSAMPYADLTLKASDARIGAFRLPADMLDLSAMETLRVTEGAPLAKGRAIHGYIYIGNNPDAPEIGDARIQHFYAPEQDVSIVARQQGDTFAQFSVSGGERTIRMLKPGLYDASAMFDAAQDENALLTWLLRVCGVLGLFAGFVLVLRPLAVAGDLVPLVGDILGMGAGLAALCLSLACGLLVIGLAWLFYRPLPGAVMLLGTVTALVGLKRLGKRKQAPNEA